MTAQTATAPTLDLTGAQQAVERALDDIDVSLDLRILADIVNAAAPAIAEQVRKHIADLAEQDLEWHRAEGPTVCEDSQSGWCHFALAQTIYGRQDKALHRLISRLGDAP